MTADGANQRWARVRERLREALAKLANPICTNCHGRGWVPDCGKDRLCWCTTRQAIAARDARRRYTQ